MKHLICQKSPTNKGTIREKSGGQRCFLARRLIESGVRFVSLTYGGWDMHQNIEAGFNKQGPELDKAFASLINDLDERGLLDSTLVMLSSEFGRTPKINKDSGRDHYPRVFSVALAGGGITRGQVYGSSDAFATAPEDNPLSVEDLATTVYDRIGIVADKELMAPGDRPMEIVDGGKVIKELAFSIFYMNLTSKDYSLRSIFKFLPNEIVFYFLLLA